MIDQSWHDLSHTTPGTPPSTQVHQYSRTPVRHSSSKCAMGSNMALRNSLQVLEVNLRPTNCLLALF